MNFNLETITNSFHSSTELFNMVLSNGSVIKSLRLMIVNLNDFKHNFLDVLCYLPHLEELSLHVNIKCLDMWAKRDMDEFFQPKTLPLLRKLDMYWTHQQGDEQQLETLCKKHVSMTPNLEELKIHRSDWDLPINQEFLVAYLGEIIRLQLEWKEEGKMPFQNLAFITLKTNEITSEKMFLKCLDFLQPLKGLDIDVTLGYSCKKAHEITSTWEMLIHKHSSTLEKLSIAYKTRENSDISFTLPEEMPRLRQLTLEW
jgi:hypothetical protein